MDGEQNGTQAQQQGAQQSQQETQQGTQSAGKPAGDPAGASGAGASANATTYESQLAERDKRIAELKVQGESERVDFKPQLAGVRNVKAARALLDDHAGDIDALNAYDEYCAL